MSLLTHYNEACKLLVVIYLSIYQPEEEEEEEAREREERIWRPQALCVALC